MGSNVPLLLGWLLAGVAKDLPTLYAARVMWGCATGMQFATVPLYIGEIAEVSIIGSNVPHMLSCIAKNEFLLNFCPERAVKPDFFT